MNTFHSKLVDGHVIIYMNNFKYIVDTGSSSSFGRGTSIVINGRNFPINSIGLGGLTADSLSALSKLEIDGLIGNDILTHFDIRFTRNQVTFSDTVISHSDTSIKLPIIDLCMGVPIIMLNIERHDRRIFFDTGAKLSYLSEDLLVGTLVGEMDDFYPTLGPFKTKIYKINVGINGTVESLTFGSLPSSIRMLLELGQTKGILGTEILNKYCIILSNLTKTLVLELSNQEELFNYQHDNSESESLPIPIRPDFTRELSLD